MTRKEFENLTKRIISPEDYRLIGQRELTLTKLRMDLPLWDEDKQYIEDTLKVMA